MRLALASDGGAEAEGGDADGDPAELIRNTDKATDNLVSDTISSGFDDVTYFCSHDQS